MYFLNLRVAFIMMGSILLFPVGRMGSYLCSSNNHPAKVMSDSFIYQGKKGRSEGYKAVTRYEDEFIAVGSDGRIDRISASGAIISSQKFPGENFNSILSDDNRVIVAGDRGTILISSEKRIFSKIDCNTKDNIHSLAFFKGKIIAGSDHGEIISVDEKGYFRTTRLALKGNIVSVSARLSECFGVTDEGEIIHTFDGINWDITNFNQVYSGYYKPCYFTKVLVTENRIAITGSHNDDSPVLLFSNQGRVWTERPLNYTDDKGEKGFLAEIPNDIMYDESGDNFFLVCSNGKAIQLPSCTQCNKLVVISTEDIEGISSIDNTMVIVGEDFLVKALSLKW